MVDDFNFTHVVVWLFSCAKLQDHAAKLPDVRASNQPTPNLIRRQVPCSALNRILLIRITWYYLHGYAEINKFNDPIVSKHDIGRLDI